MLERNCKMHMKNNLMVVNIEKSPTRIENIMDYIYNSKKYKYLLEDIYFMQEDEGDLNIIWKKLPEEKILMAVSQSWEDLENELSENVHHYELIEKSVSCKDIRKLKEMFRK